MRAIFVWLTLIITAFLFLLNLGLVIVFRKRKKTEVLSYIGAGLIELAVFCVVLLFHLGVLTSIPFHLPPGLSFNRAEIAAALALGIGLFPAAYWHRVSMAQLRARMEQDARLMKMRSDGGVRIKTPEEWMT
ncbi:MAG: hypothetical protein IMW90_03295 [Thermogemmatispora sp.]|uniref:Uncharacterized protein n=2 Tax=Thermogemmatispora TaxID=768669 RepID=A0A328VM20_9CHLR|nr:MULTISPECIES: hypothetical protein [Thermogemmatispora]MBE3564732.1 hypothetical protein [Thermogemmatispora sp.]RAQ96224.1 hypothetical protein A4R35_11830 [Thermogemmatispora tikiterensis]GER82524.1 hypothetical protein KTAU_11610 [Thermogemmatispora aurantia]